MSDRLYLSADELLAESFRLGLMILDSGYRPSHVVGLWRGGTPVAIAVHELLDVCGITTDHCAIRTSLYAGVDAPAGHVALEGIDAIVRRAGPGDSVLLVDDVYDSGRTVHAVVDALRAGYPGQCPEVRVATIYRKPGKGPPSPVPHYFLTDTDRWLVFPHELAGLPIAELLARKPGIGVLRERLEQMAAASAAR